MKALITGGAGFIGSHLVEQLSTSGVPVRIFDINETDHCFEFDLSRYDFVKGDVRNEIELLKAAEDCDTIFHLAGVLGTDILVQHPKLAVHVNILGTLNVLDVARKTGATIVYPSLLPDWNSPYMITKHAAAKFCQLYFEEYGTKVIVLRVTHVYGERQKWMPIRKAIPTFIVSALQNEPLRIYGTGKQLMDLIYVEDAVMAMIKAAETPNAIGSSLELGSGIGTRVVDLASGIIELCHSKSRLKFVGHRPGEPDSSDAFVPADIGRLATVLGISPRVDLQVGLDRTITWYRQFALPQIPI